VAGLAGIAAAFLFPGLIVLTTALEWGWMHDELGWRLTESTDVPYPSGLANGPVGFLQVANFALTGLLVLLWARGVAETLRPGISRHVAKFGMAVMGVALTTSAFPTDFFAATTADQTPVSWHGWIHNISFYVLMLVGLMPATIAFAVNARRNPVWRRWALPTLLVPCMLVASIFGLLPDPYGFYGLIVVWLGWIGLTGTRLRRLS
jgi:hypothetical protein